MARVPSLTRQAQVTVDKLHAHDVLVKGHESWTVESRTWSGGKVLLVVRAQDLSVREYRLDPAYLVAVLVEHDCGCAGSGIFRGGGVIENGVYKGYSGKCYPCNGKGWQDRADVIRNVTYWNKYARVAC